MKKIIQFMKSDRLWVKILCSLLILSVVLIVLYTGISFAAKKVLAFLFPDGRGDWAVNLIGPYDIVKVNSADIICGYRNNETQTWERVVDGFFVDGYQVHEPYIFLQGYVIEGNYIKDEEKIENLLVYYVIDSQTEVVYGPLEEDGFKIWVDDLKFSEERQWTSTKYKPEGATP